MAPCSLGPGYIWSRNFVLADDLREHDLRNSSALMEMQPRLVVVDREVDGFLWAASQC